MKEITVAAISTVQSGADIKARLTEEGGVGIWFEYKGGQPYLRTAKT